MRLALVVLVLLLAGCSRADPPFVTPTATTEPSVSPTDPIEPTPGDRELARSGWRIDGAPIALTYYLTSEGALALDPPPAGKADAASFADAAQPAASFDGRPWLAPPVERAYLVRPFGFEARVVLASDAGAVAARSAGLESADAYLWFGDASQLRVRDAILGAPAQLAPGETATFTSAFLGLPTEGLVLEAGARPSFYALVHYTAPKGTLHFLTGAEGTRVALQLTPLVLAPLGEPSTLLDVSGVLKGRAPGASEEGPHVAREILPLAWSSGIRRVEVVVEAAPGTARSDLDLALLYPSGTAALAESLTPFANERIDLFAPHADEDGDHVLVVRNNAQVDASYRLTVRVWAAAS